MLYVDFCRLKGFIFNIFLYLISKLLDVCNIISIMWNRLTHNFNYDAGVFFTSVCNEHYIKRIRCNKYHQKGLNEMYSMDVSEKKKAIIAVTWEYLLQTGLANASIGDLCKKAHLAQSSLYYWFENKDDIWISAGKYGLSRVVDALFDFTLRHTNDVRKYFDTLLCEVEKYKYELRLALQITTSPIYGKRMRDKSKDFRLLYEKYAEKIICIFGCTYNQAETFIYSIIAFVIDYAIWDDGDKTQMLLENLYNRTISVLHTQTQQ